MESGIGARLIYGKMCADCGAAIVAVNCNDEMAVFAHSMEAGASGWWWYCANKGCTYHVGEGVFQIGPDWVVDGAPS